MTEGEIEALREEMDEQRDEIREALAAQLGGSPDEFSADQYLESEDGDSGEAVPDGGE